MPWNGVNPVGGAKLYTVTTSFPTLASAAVSGVPIAVYPFAQPGRLVSIMLIADAITGTPGARFRRNDVSAVTQVETVNADKNFVADAGTRIDADDTNTVAAQQGFDQGDVLLMDKNASGDITRGLVQSTFSVG